MTAVRRSREAMIAETTAKLLAAARRSFADHGYAGTSMDDLCAEVGLTRGALYHHFGGKDGLLEAVAVEINAEVEQCLDTRYRSIADPWQAFRACCLLWLEIALQPEIRRILLQDAPAVLGQRFREHDQRSSIGPIAGSLLELMDKGRIRRANPEALARVLNGAMVDAALWIAASDDQSATLRRATEALDLVLDGLLIERD